MSWVGYLGGCSRVGGIVHITVGAVCSQTGAAIFSGSREVQSPLHDVNPTGKSWETRNMWFISTPGDGS